MVLTFKGILLSLALAVPIWAAQQSPPSEKVVHLEIRGRVVEFGGSQGIGDAEVTMERYKGPAVSSFVERSRVGTAKTDVSGSFVFDLESPGTYRLTVAKDGYGQPGGTLDRVNWTSTDISVDTDRPTGDVRFVLARPGEIAGRVVDGDTQKPVAGMDVRLLQHGYVRGRVWFMPGGQAITDAKGRFVAPKLPPTDYVIVLQPRIRYARDLERNPTIQGEARMLTEFSEKDLKTVDHDYDSTYWPGGPDATDAFPVALGSGAQIDVGLLTVSKVPKYRVRVSVLGEPCSPGERVVLNVAKPSNTVADGTVGAAPCGQEVLIRGFAPGSYQLEVSAGREKRGWVPFRIVDENLAIAVPISRGVDIDGRVLISEGASRPDFQSMKILLAPLGWAVQNEPGTADAAGHFTISNVLARDFKLLVSGVPKTHYMKEIRYNGRRLTDDILAVDGHAQAHSLELILEDKPAVVVGAVTDDDKPIRRPYAVLVRWPPNSRDMFSSVSGVLGDESGRFQFAGLAPGDYRLLAVSADDRAKLERPNALARVLEGAERLSLGERQYQSVTLRLTKP
jgi:hypothetical protein